MREIYKTYSQKGKKQVNITTISVALLIAAMFIFAAATPVMSIQTHTTKLNVNAPEEKIISSGPAPRTAATSYPADLKNPQTMPAPILDCYTMYAHQSWSTDDKLVYFDTCNPGTLTDLGDSIAGNPCSGGTFGCDGIWYLAQYDNGLLYGADIFTGDMWSIGGGGQGLNTLAYDPMENRMYGVYGPGSPGNDLLIEIDPDTGEQTQIGTLGGSIYFTIGMAFDAEGTLYGWDVATDDLFTIDTETGVATVVVPLTIDLNFGQDGDFHRETDTIYLTACTSAGTTGLYTCDKETGQCTLIGGFPGNVQLTGSCFEQYCKPLEHDVGLKSIDSPLTGRAEPDMDMLITVKNYGNNTETFDAQMEIIKCEGGPLIMEEYFDDCVLPDNWTTDYWTIYNSNVAGGDPCEARCYKYDQYYAGQYYDNYIMSPDVDCTGLEKVNLKFRWAADYGSYATTATPYVKFRRNHTSPWVDVTPWDVPPGENQDGQLYEIGCYGFGEPMGEEFQFMWNYVGYYYYFNYLWLDDVTLEACGGCAEYAELEEDITLAPGEEAQISFPGWTPSEWQNESSENTWEEYPIHAFVIIDEDENPRNDGKWILINLWYPWMHDIEVMSIDSPHDPEGRSLPGQTFPVQATMRNVGQNAECCIPIAVNIGNPYIIDTAFTEYDWPGSGTYYPGEYSGWTDEHKYVSYYYGFWRYYGSYSGGSPYEAYLIYAYAVQDYHFYSMAIDTSDYSMLRLRFLSYINHYSGQGLYSLEAGYSTDLETWYAAWHEEPGSSQSFGQVDVPIAGGSETTYIGFWIKGDPWYFNYWYIDNIELVAMGFDEEYSDFACQGPDLEPGEEATFTFDDWTPARLAEQTSGSEDYIIEASIECPTDKNPGNDIKTEGLTLDFWHDVGIDRIESPADGRNRDRWDIQGQFDIYASTGHLGNTGAEFDGEYIYSCVWSSNTISQHETDGTLVKEFTASPATGLRDLAWDGELLWGGTASSTIWGIDPDSETVVETITGGFAARAIAYNEDEDTFFVSDWGDPVYEVDRSGTVVRTFNLGSTTSTYGFAYDNIDPDGPFLWVFDQSGSPVATVYQWDLTAMEYTGMTHNVGADIGYGSAGGIFFAPGFVSGTATLGCCLQGGLTSTPDMMIMYEMCEAGGAPTPKVYIRPGTEDIEAVVKNYGTFIKEDLTCYASIKEFITDPENGTEVYTDEIGNIDLTTPLGGEKDLVFDDFTFADEGVYGLYLNFPASPDDKQKNNKVTLGIGVDDTDPFCDPEPWLDPGKPDGLRGWYVNDVTVTLNATDPIHGGLASGVREIRYTVNGGSEQVLPGKTGTFVLTEDGEDILVEYWAIDNVGNVESPKNSFTVSIDQTVPDVTLTYEVTEGNPIQGWTFTFTAEAYDDMSDMQRVEFLFNGVLQETVEGSGPIYSWSLQYWPIPHATFTAVAYDNAGLFASDDVVDPVTSAHSTPAPTLKTSESPNANPLPR